MKQNRTGDISMQILVISDTHGRYDILRKVLSEHRDAAFVIHCGDGEYETERLIAEHPELKQWILQVRGNCDHDRAIPLVREIELPYGHKAVAVHGHTMMHGDLQQNLVDLAKECGADIVLFGHLHVRIDRNVEGIRLFSPGSAAQPRDQFPPGFGLLDVMEGGILTSH
ncbi:MAG: YfcE family phosphodiesterase, partial [Oscillospiraceae bacterium]|nr:YfcE family phosphodiesterase [Oscillospiraceae bacterium]